jgi:hypothetical protein
MQCIHFASGITIAKSILLVYVTLIAFPRQLWFREYPCILYSHVHCLHFRYSTALFLSSYQLYSFNRFPFDVSSLLFFFFIFLSLSFTFSQVYPFIVHTVSVSYFHVFHIFISSSASTFHNFNLYFNFVFTTLHM